MRHKRKWRTGGRPKCAAKPVSRGKQKQRLKVQARAWGSWRGENSCDTGSGLPSKGGDSTRRARRRSTKRTAMPARLWFAMTQISRSGALMSTISRWKWPWRSARASSKRSTQIRISTRRCTIWIVPISPKTVKWRMWIS